MKKIYFLPASLLLLVFTLSCNNKKYTEVVEVPLPTAQEKIEIGNPDDVKADDGAFLMEKLPYSYNALAPAVSALTMEMHYSKHYLTYTNNLNKALAGTDLENLSIEEVLAKLDLNNDELRNNAGGYYNHSLYWKCMTPKSDVKEAKVVDSLSLAITRKYGSFDNFKTAFTLEASSQFGSAWTWLIVDKYGNLQITSTQNQDNPLMRNAVIPGTPILALDLWEHAYYLGYQYRRRSYIESFFDVINWKKVGENYDAALKRK
jgi:superoxide dismutase, Fe-Mn family